MRCISSVPSEKYFESSKIGIAVKQGLKGDFALVLHDKCMQKPSDKC